MPLPSHSRQRASGAQLTLLLFACACGGASGVSGVEAQAPASTSKPESSTVAVAPEVVSADDRAPVVEDEPPAQTRQEVLRRGVKQFRACYLLALASDPRAHGKATLELTLAADGRVTAATASSDRGVEQIEPCLLRVSRDLVFPPLDPLDDRELSVPIVFMPGR